MLLIKIKKTKKRFRAYPTHQAVQTTGSTAHISNINPDTELHLAIFWQVDIPPGYFLLNLCCTIDGIYDTIKIGHNIVTNSIHYPATIVPN